MKKENKQCHPKLDLESHHMILRNDEILNQVQDDKKQSSLMTANGFTLIEILVVVLIIGVLAAIALPHYQRAIRVSEYQKYIVIGDIFAKAQILYYLEHGAYATDLHDLTIPLPSPTRITANSAYYPWGKVTLRNEYNSDIQIYSSGKLPTHQVTPYPNGRGWFRKCHATYTNAMHQHICQSVAGPNVRPTETTEYIYWTF